LIKDDFVNCHQKHIRVVGAIGYILSFEKNEQEKATPEKIPFV